jgi:hypothetical protein
MSVLAPTSLKRISRTVFGIGEKAEVVANKATGKFVSAHDLRRSFAVAGRHA